jgi:hypothetical protein
MSAPDIEKRLREWVEGFDKSQNPSTWVARELIVEALEELESSRRLIKLSATVSLKIIDEFLGDIKKRRADTSSGDSNG